jgi:hypothetical protein
LSPRARAVAVAVVLGAVAAPLPARAQQQPAAGAAPTAGATYEVRLERGTQVGARRRVATTGEQHMTTRAVRAGSAPEERHQDLTVQMDAVERVLAVNARGQPTQSEFSISRFAATGAPAGTTLPHDGQVLRLTRAALSEQSTLTLDGQPVSHALRELLDVVLDLSIDALSDDDVFGTTQRQAVGASWPIHADLAQRDLASTRGIDATLSGQTRLVQRGVVQGADALEVAGTMHGNITRSSDMPASSTLRRGVMDMTYRAALPLDAARGRLNDGTEMRLDLQVSAQDQGRAVDVHVTMQGRRSATYTAM